jgi:heat shock protein HtpX
MGNSIRTVLLMTVLTVLFVWLGGALAGRGGAILAFVVAAGTNFWAYWKSDKMVLKHYRALELGPEDSSRLYGTVAELAPRAGLPMPKVYLIPDKAPNAFATGRNPRHAAVAATEGVVDLLDEDELAGVMAHELTHVRNRDILTGTIAATFAGAIAMLAQVARFGAMGGQQQRRANPLAMILIVVAAPLAAMILRMAVSRTREFMADEGGAEVSGRPLGLASALEKISRAARLTPLERLNPAHSHMFIVSPFLGSGLAKLFASHPPAEERIQRLRAMAGRGGSEAAG